MTTLENRQVKLLIVMIMAFIGESTGWITLLHKTVPLFKDLKSDSPEFNFVNDLIT